MIINDSDQAYAEMRDIVANIAGTYGDDAEDVSQSMWLAVFRYLADHGASDAGLLITRAKFAAIDEINEIRGHGFRPQESKYPPPCRVTPAWVQGSTEIDPDFDEPAAKDIPEASTDLFDHLLTLCTDDDQRAICKAGKALTAAHTEDGSVKIGTMTSLMRQTKLSKARIEKAQQALAAKLRP